MALSAKKVPQGPRFNAGELPNHVIRVLRIAGICPFCFHIVGRKVEHPCPGCGEPLPSHPEDHTEPVKDCCCVLCMYSDPPKVRKGR